MGRRPFLERSSAPCRDVVSVTLPGDLRSSMAPGHGLQELVDVSAERKTGSLHDATGLRVCRRVGPGSRRLDLARVVPVQPASARPRRPRRAVVHPAAAHRAPLLHRRCRPSCADRQSRVQELRPVRQELLARTVDAQQAVTRRGRPADLLRRLRRVPEPQRVPSGDPLPRQVRHRAAQAGPGLRVRARPRVGAPPRAGDRYRRSRAGTGLRLLPHLRAPQPRGRPGVVQERRHRLLVRHRPVHQLGARRRELLLGAVGGSVHLQREGVRDPAAHGRDEPAVGPAPRAPELSRGSARDRLGPKRRRVRVTARVGDLHRRVDLLVRDTEPHRPDGDVGVLRAHGPLDDLLRLALHPRRRRRPGHRPGQRVGRGEDDRAPDGQAAVPGRHRRRCHRRVPATVGSAPVGGRGRRAGPRPGGYPVGEDSASEGSRKDTAPA